jgi:glucuronate isomerase
MSVLSGSYSKDGVEAIVSQGPAWWWCDHYQGMREMLDHLCVYGVMSTFIGMTTDSRSLLSFVRHDYFRRILCQWIGNQVQQGILPDDFAILSDTVRRIYNEAVFFEGNV